MREGAGLVVGMLPLARVDFVEDAACADDARGEFECSV
jgi:hypothetical protein